MAWLDRASARGQGRRWWMAGVAGLTVAAACSAAQAQSAADAGSTASGDAQLDEVVVTAQRREQRLQDVPMAISAIGGAEVAARGIGDSRQLFDNVPNLNLSRRGGNAPVPSIRGVYQAIQDPTAEPSVAFYIDGVYVPSVNQLDLSLVNIERVEVLRGPQGSLYGKNAIGGAINIISRGPTDEFTATGALAYGSRDSLAANFSVSGPIVEDRLSARISAAVRRSDGYLLNTFTGNKVEYDDYRGVMLALKATPSEKLTLDLSLDAMKSNPSRGNFEFIAGSAKENCRARPAGSLAPTAGCPAPLAGIPFFAGFGYPYNSTPGDRVMTADLEAREDQTGYGASLVGTYAFPSFDLVSVSGYRFFDFDAVTNQDRSAYPIFGRYPVVGSTITPTTPPIPREADGFNYFFRSESISQEVRLVSTGDGPLEWVVGAYGFRDEKTLRVLATLGRQGVFTAGPGRTIFDYVLDERSRIESRSLAIFGQATYRVTEQLSATVGGRYSKERISIDLDSVCDLQFQCPAFLGNPPATRSASNSTGVFTPMATLSYKWTDDILTYVTASRGFKSGGYAPVFTFAVTPFDPEYAWNYEAGAKTTWLDGRLVVNATAFWIDWRDVQENSFNATQGFRVRNAAKARNRGFEIDLQAKPTRMLLLGGSYGYLDSKYLKFPNATATLDLSGTRRPLVPKHSFSAYGQLSVPVANGWEAVARADYSYKGDIIYQNVNATPIRIAKESYGVVNARLGLESDRWSVSLWARNLTDEDYYTFIDSFPGPVDAPYGVVGEPRTYGVEIRASF